MGIGPLMQQVKRTKHVTTSKKDELEFKNVEVNIGTVDGGLGPIAIILGLAHPGS